MKKGAIIFAGLVARVAAWVVMHEGVLLALRLAEAEIAESAFHTLSPFEKLSNGGLVLALVAFLLSCVTSAIAVILHLITIVATKTKWRPGRLHLLLWSRLALLLALGTHLVGEIGLRSRGPGGIWQPADIRALALAVCFALLLVLDVFIDWIHPVAMRTREAE